MSESILHSFQMECLNLSTHVHSLALKSFINQSFGGTLMGSDPEGFWPGSRERRLVGKTGSRLTASATIKQGTSLRPDPEPHSQRRTPEES